MPLRSLQGQFVDGATVWFCLLAGWVARSNEAHCHSKAQPIFPHPAGVHLYRTGRADTGMQCRTHDVRTLLYQHSIKYDADIVCVIYEIMIVDAGIVLSNRAYFFILVIYFNFLIVLIKMTFHGIDTN